MPERNRPRALAALLVAALCAVSAAPAALAAVADAGENGFTIRIVLRVDVPPEKAYAAAVAVGRWWQSEHTYSGDASNLSLEPRPGGCWCEKLPGGGGVQHMTVVNASPGKGLRLSGGLGPLQSMGVAGAMSFDFAPAEKGTEVRFTYAVGGYAAGGFKAMAAGVDGVLQAQLERYKRYAETGKP